VKKFASAEIKGGTLYPQIKGVVYFYKTLGGVMVTVKINGLPLFSRENGKVIGPHGFHIHTGSSCDAGTNEDPFFKAGLHYNPNNQLHGNHAGDFPVIFSNSGYATMSFFTNKFNIDDIIGKVVILHESPDDYRTDPSGNSGKKIACGVIN